jgi:hypothetical protein
MPDKSNAWNHAKDDARRVTRVVRPRSRRGLVVRIAVLTLALVAVGLTLGRLTAGESASVSGATPAQQARLIDNLRTVAASNGDPSVRSATVVATTRGAFAALTDKAGDLPVMLDNFPDDPIFVITLHGNFTLYGASVPRGAAFPTGHTLLLVVRTTDFELLEDHLLNSPLDLASLGQAQTLDLSASATQ